MLNKNRGELSTHSVSDFLREDYYVNFHDPLFDDCIDTLFQETSSRVEKIYRAYEFVRDEISHSFDSEPLCITVTASDVLCYKTGICHAKANLLAALLRSQGIPVGFCYQRITLAEDDSQGYCVHCFNAVYVGDRWIKIDARGNTGTIDAQVSFGKPQLAYPNREGFDEYFWDGIYSSPHKETMAMLESAKTVQDIRDNIPDTLTSIPDVPTCNPETLLNDPDMQERTV